MKDLSRVFCTLSSTDKFDAIDEVISSCSIFTELPDRNRFIETVHRRERVQSTGIGHGVAIAHGKVAHIEGVYVGLGFSERGIIFDQHYPEPVRLVFVIASCPVKEADYLRATASILTWVHDPEFRKVLVGKEWDDERVVRFFDMLSSQHFVPQFQTR